MPEPLTLVAIGGGTVAVAIRLARRYFDLAKEVVDIVIGTIALILALPVLALCAVIVKLSGRGPIIYTQLRVGQYGQLFRIYKLRTMYAGAESASGAVWAKDDDPRVIPTCRWMRRSHMDELPQLINVIKGEMSLVGPRPERPEILAGLEKAYPDVRKRLVVRPGITGLAQIRNGYDTSIDAFRHKLEADLEYIERRKWATELRIMAATFSKLSDKGAH